MERDATAPAPTDQDVARLYPMAVEACVARPDMAGWPLTAGEAACIAGAGPERRREYAQGRAALRSALGRLGAAAASLPSRADRSPVVPQGFVASLSHCRGFCAAVAARAAEVRSLGFDAEPAEPLEAALGSLVCGPLDGTDGGPLQRRLAPTVVFSAKEAVYKCQYPLAAAPLDFPDLGIRFRPGGDGSHGRFHAVFRRDLPAALLTRRFQGAWRLAGGLVLTAAWPEPP